MRRGGGGGVADGDQACGTANSQRLEEHSNLETVAGSLLRRCCRLFLARSKCLLTASLQELLALAFHSRFNVLLLLPFSSTLKSFRTTGPSLVL